MEHHSITSLLHSTLIMLALRMSWAVLCWQYVSVFQDSCHLWCDTVSLGISPRFKGSQHFTFFACLTPKMKAFCNYLSTLITSLSNMIRGKRVCNNSTVPHIFITAPTVTPPLSSLQWHRNDNWTEIQSLLNIIDLFLVCHSEHWKMW